MYWLEPLIVKLLFVEPDSLALVKSILGYAPSDNFIPTIPPAIEPERLIVDCELILITGVLM